MKIYFRGVGGGLYMKMKIEHQKPANTKLERNESGHLIKKKKIQNQKAFNYNKTDPRFSKTCR